MRATLNAPEQPASDRRRSVSPHILFEQAATAFVGPTERGPIDPCLVTNLAGLRAIYGEPLAPQRSFLAPALQGYFENGGVCAYVTRVVSPDARPALFQIRLGEHHSLADWARSPGTWEAASS